MKIGVRSLLNFLGWMLCSVPLTLSAQQWGWVANYGTAATFGRGIAVDSAGNNYTVGSFDGTLTLGTNVLGSSGGNNRPDLFLAKHTVSGQVLWAKKAGGTGTDIGNAVALDAANSAVYVTGSSDSFTFSFGTTSITASGQNIFLAKYDLNGNFVWVRQAIKYNFSDSPAGAGISVAVDGSGNVYFAGNFTGIQNFGGTPHPPFGAPTGGYNVTNANIDADIFVAKYDSAGNALWAKRYGGANLDEVGGVAVTPSGIIYLAGRFNGSATYGPDTLTSLNTSYDTDCFLAKLDTNGNPIWGRDGGGGDTDRCLAVAVDSTGAGYIACACRAADMTIGGTTLPRAPDEYTDAFLVKFNSSGTLAWGRTIGRPGTGPSTADTACGLAVDSGDHVLFCGSFDQDARFGNGVTLTGGGQDFFLVKYTSAGAALWARKPVSPIVAETAYGVAVDGGGNAYVTGVLNNSSPGAQAAFDTVNITMLGTRDLFIGRLNVNAQSGPVLQVARTQGSLVFSWPVASAGFTLRSTTNLYAAYADFPGTRTTNLVGQTVTVTVSIDQGIRFFRLFQP